MMVAIMLIFFILVAQFDSVTSPLVVMSAVALSLGGVCLGLAIHDMPFGIIMTSVGVISLAGVVVNNAIVLVDYIQQLIARGMTRADAIVAAGATRLRPVLLTAVTTILGLVPMVTGVNINFQPLKRLAFPSIQWYSESSQWWASMAVAVIWGLGLATLLTLFVVPVLFSLGQSFQCAMTKALRAIRWGLYAVAYEWWNHFDKRHDTGYAKRWALAYAKAMEDKPAQAQEPLQQ